MMSLLITQAFAAPLDSNDAQQPTVALIFVNNAKATYDDEVTTKVMTNFDTLFKNKYVVQPGAPYIAALAKSGITDVTNSERDDILSVFKNENVDYIVLAEVQPFIKKQMVTFFTVGVGMTAIVPVKIIGVKENKYYYVGKFSEYAREDTAIGAPSNKGAALKAMDQIFVKMNAAITERLPLSKPVIQEMTLPVK